MVGSGVGGSAVDLVLLPLSGILSLRVGSFVLAGNVKVSDSRVVRFFLPVCYL